MVVLGHGGVGKTTFINHCIVSGAMLVQRCLGDGMCVCVCVQQHSQDAAGTSRYSKVMICGRDISIRIVDNPGRQHLVPAIMIILLFDLTQLVHAHAFTCMYRRILMHAWTQLNAQCFLFC